MQTAGRTGLDASGFESLTYSIRAEGALVNLLGFLVELWNVEGTARDAVSATDAVLLLKVDDAVFVFDDRAIGGTGAQATRIFAVHALIFPHQPHQVTVALVLGKFDQIPIVPFGRRHRLVSVIERRLAKRMIVPFDAGNFAGFATDAGRHVDVLAAFLCAFRALARHRSGMGRDFLNLKSSWITHFTVSQLSMLGAIHDRQDVAVR